MSVFRNFARYFTFACNLRVNHCLSQPLKNGLRPPDNPLLSVCTAKCHTSPKVSGLMEFFDSKDNWQKDSVKVGRSWRLDELRIKSNGDLHKLWFVLLKERNMLLTLEHECKEKYVAMPNPERIDKVEESMKNIESVVRERNRAYHMLETGETGERPVVKTENSFGLPYFRKLKEHCIERKYNASFAAYYQKYFRIAYPLDVKWFQQRYKEKQNLRKLALARKQFRTVCKIFRRFEGVDEEAIKAEYPLVDVEAAKMHKDSRGPRINPY